MVKITLAFMSVVLLVSCTPPRRKCRLRCAPTSRRQARCAPAINYGNPVLAQGSPATGDLRGITVDLSRELGRRIGVPVELVPYDAAGKMTDALKTGAWDVAFLAVDPRARRRSAFTAPYLEIEGTYLVPAGVADSHDRGRGPRGRAHRRRGQERLRSFPEPQPDARANRARADGPRSGRPVQDGQARSRRRRQAGARHRRREDSRLPRARGSVHGDCAGGGRAERPRRRRAGTCASSSKTPRPSGFVAEALKKSGVEAARRSRRPRRFNRVEQVSDSGGHGGQATDAARADCASRHVRTPSSPGRTSSTCCTPSACSRGSWAPPR